MRQTPLLPVFVLMPLLYFFLTLSPVAPAAAAGIQPFIVPPQEAATAGTPTRFILFLQNMGNGAIQTTDYNRMDLTLEKEDTPEVRTEALPVDRNPAAPVTIPAGGFVKLAYEFTLPQDFDGTIRMSLDGIVATPVLFSAAPMPIKERTEQIALGEKQSMFQPLLKNLSAYEPMYFLMGVDPGTDKSKFQVSFKYKVFDMDEEEDHWYSFLDGIHMAYTQTSFWDLKSDSKPFDDTSYKPEIFYFVPKIDLGLDWVRAFGLQAGYKHESNGKDGDDSRSTNFLYIEPIFGFYLGGDYFMSLRPRVWTYVANDDSTNGDLDQYRGYFNLGLTVGALDSFVLDTNTRWGEKGPSFQADLTYPLNKIFYQRFNYYLHFQYFTGYAENLVDFREREDIFRIGLSIVR